MQEAVAAADAEFRRLVREASQHDKTGLSLSTRGFVEAVRALEALIREREGQGGGGQTSLEQLRADVARKQEVLERHRGDLARWRGELQTAVDEAEQVLLDRK